jgi:saccharopine dehydrogenase-like NADP-dependent oxidoreductase
MALDLAEEFDVLLCDIDGDRLADIESQHGIRTKQADLTLEKKVGECVSNADLVINAVPGNIGYQTLERIIRQGRNVVDIAFFPEDLYGLEELALKHKVVAVCDAGVAPGMSNLLAAHAHHSLDETHSIRIYVGGLPKVRSWPYEYKAVFSPSDVIEEYVRPARFIRNGKEVSMPALTEPEFLEFQGAGTLEAFNSDGLRSLMKTLECPDMVEKTLRYPGHREKMLMLRETGFFSEKAIEIGGNMVKPLDVTKKLLFPQWQLKGEEHDITVMKIIVEGVQGSEKKTVTWDLYDEYDIETGIHSMARTTGYTATGIARLILDDGYTLPGIHPPEDLAADHEIVEFMLNHLGERGIEYKLAVGS